MDKLGGDPAVTGERAHITAAKPTGPRYDEALSEHERNDYSNLILLCGSCHNKVDAAPRHYTTAVLHSIKAAHESYCSNLLTLDDEHRAIKGEILANAVDFVVDSLSLERWSEWTQRALGPGPYAIPEWWYREFRLEIRPTLEAVLWPDDTLDLEISAKMAVDAIIAFFAIFCQHSPSEDRDLADTHITCDSVGKLLRRMTWGDYHTNERALRDWDDSLELALVHFAKCVNWFSDAVRRHVNPRFRITDGAFILSDADRLYGEYGVFTFSTVERERILARGYVAGEASDIWMTVGETWQQAPERRYGGTSLTD